MRTKRHFAAFAQKAASLRFTELRIGLQWYECSLRLGGKAAPCVALDRPADLPNLAQLCDHFMRDPKITADFYV